MEKKALCPGSFDPFTAGHQIIIDKSLALFDKVIVAIGINTKKKSYFSLEKRMALIRKVYADEPRVEVVSYDNLTADYCRERDIHFIIRGIRNVGDFEFERNVAQINKRLFEELETIFLMTPPEFSEISSSVVREILEHKSDPTQFMPGCITLEDLQE